MKLRELLEATEKGDSAARKKAEDFAERAAKLIARKTPKTLDRIEGDALDVDYPDVAIVLDWGDDLKSDGVLIKKDKFLKNITKNKETGDSSLELVNRLFRDAEYIIVLGPRILTSSAAPQLIREVIIHEFTHYLDDKRYDGSEIRTYSRKKDSKKHYNSPHEFNAYYQQGASRAITLAKKDTTKKPLSHYISDKFIRSIWSRDWYDALTTRTKKRLKKRIANLYNEIISTQFASGSKKRIWDDLFKKLYDEIALTTTEHDALALASPSFGRFMDGTLPAYIKDRKFRKAIEGNNTLITHIHHEYDNVMKFIAALHG